MDNRFAIRIGMLGLFAATCCIPNTNAMAATPPAPQVQPLPTGVLAVDNAVPQSVTFSWFQPVAVAKQPPVEATTFAICVQDPVFMSSHPCETQLGANSSTGVWTRPATDASLHRTAVYTGSPFSPARLLTGYNYWTTITLNNTFYDRSLRWSLAACAAKVASTCMTTGAPFAWYSTKELIANVNVQFVQPTLFATAEAHNFGTTSADQFVSRVTAYPALVGVSGACATDPNEPGLNVTNATKLITAGGQVLLAGNFRSGNQFDVSGLGVIAMVNATVIFGAAAGAPGTIYGPPFAPLPLPSQPSTGNPWLTAMVTRSFDVSAVPAQPNQTQRFAIAAIASIDDLNQIKEVNEADNKRAECKSFLY